MSAQWHAEVRACSTVHADLQREGERGAALVFAWIVIRRQIRGGQGERISKAHGSPDTSSRPEKGNYVYRKQC